MKFKSIFILAILLSGQLLAYCQYVLVPDSNLRQKLISLGYSSCFSGNLLDTTCPLLSVTHSLVISNCEVANLEGLQYFRNLDSLNCSQNKIVQLSPLPNSLTYLDCSSNYYYLNSIPQLPGNLQEFICGYNYSIHVLPPLPGSLTFLDCGYDSLVSLPALPASLTSLYCGEGFLTTLPDLPVTLQHLTCPNNQLSALPVLPNSLVSLTCDYNRLAALPLLGDSMRVLYCRNNLLTVLPSLPRQLLYMDASFNSFSDLPALPDSIRMLNIAHCENLHCLPWLPNRLQNLYLWGTSVACLPNQPNMQPFLCNCDFDVPLCSDSNPNNCPLLSAIEFVNREADMYVTVFPNPTSAAIQIHTKETLNAHFQLFNAFGTLVKEILISDYDNKLGCENLPAGLYSWQLEASSKILQRGKLVME